ncbi:MAG: CoA ester lyase [Verrucomicrobiae bacterium]|nr:CoA ester lyase [Verrucomicrobiae bacterium]
MSVAYKSLLYVPANKPAMMEKSRGLPCHAVIFDLEDAVSPDEKEFARESLLEIVQASYAKPYFVRINPAGTEDHEKDLVILKKLHPQGIFLPKANAEAVFFTARTLVTLGGPNEKLALIPLIESALAVETMISILDASPRVRAAQLGAEDLTADLGVQRTKAGKELDYARHRVAYGCRARGLPAYDTPFMDIQDLAGLAEDCRRAKRAGFSGKTCIHPNQLETVNLAFTPTAGELHEAEKIVRAAEKAQTGVFLLEGRMVDAPVIQRARQILARR